MNAEEIKNKLKKLKDREFMINMKDRFTVDDYQLIAKLDKEIAELEQELETVEED